MSIYPKDELDTLTAAVALNTAAHGTHGATPGTAEADKALVVDSNIDIAALRNVTATGIIQALTLTATAALNAVSGVFSGAISGASAAITGAITALTATITSYFMSSVGGATPAVALRLGATITEGYEILVYDEIIDLPNAAFVNTSLVLPAGAIILSMQGNLEKLVVGDASGDNLMADVGLGISGGDPDAYAEFGALTKNSKADGLPTRAPLASAVTVAIFGLQADGDTVCTELFVASTADVRVRCVYAAANSLDDAA